MSDSLCQRCGLCCDGSLFARVPLGVNEVVPEVELGVVRNEKGGRHVPQRCRALEGTQCRYYEARPLACRRYECLLWTALRSGEVSEAEADQVVARAKVLVQAAARDASVKPERDAYLDFHFGRRT